MQFANGTQIPIGTLVQPFSGETAERLHGDQ